MSAARIASASRAIIDDVGPKSGMSSTVLDAHPILRPEPPATRRHKRLVRALFASVGKDVAQVLDVV